MPEQLTYPGIYLRERPSGVRTITGVATSITAFVGSAVKGDVNEPTTVLTLADFVRQFGPVDPRHRLGYAVADFFANGGGEAVVVRVAGSGATPATFALPAVAGPSGGDAGGETNGGDAGGDAGGETNGGDAGGETNGGDAGGTGGGETTGGGPAAAPAPAALSLRARSPGSWGDSLQVTVDHQTRPDASGATRAKDFNLTVTPPEEGATPETLRNLSTDPTETRYAVTTINRESAYLRVAGPAPGTPLTRPGTGNATVTSGADGADIAETNVIGTAGPPPTGMRALANADLFNLLVLPPPQVGAPISQAGHRTALSFCREHRAFLLAEAVTDGGTPAYLEGGWGTAATRRSVVQGLGPGSKDAEYGAIYFPQLRRGADTVPSTPSVAGAIARNDALRGVWKAPAGIETGLDADGVSQPLSDEENGQLNPLGINVVRNLPLYGTVVWGSRTIAGADEIGSEYKYVPVRRTALFIEESLYRALKWVVFEPNDEPLWSQIRLNVGAFMQGLFLQGAFQGTSPRDAYFVRCDSDTTTQNDINLGIVNIVVGFAPLKPAEFVVITIQQIAGQIQT